MASAAFLALADNSIKNRKKKKGEKSPRKKKVKNVENSNALVDESNQFDDDTDKCSNEQHGTHNDTLSSFFLFFFVFPRILTCM